MPARRGIGTVVAVLVLVASGCDRTVSRPCTVETEAGGARRLVCPDGTSHAFPEERVPARRGSVEGTALRFGEPDRAGLAVRLYLAPRTPDDGPVLRQQLTDERGFFRFEDIEPGVHLLEVSAAGFAVDRREVVVEPRPFAFPEAIVLRRGRLVVEEPVFDLELSPDGGAFLVWTPEGKVTLWEPGRGPLQVAARVETTNTAFTPDGRFVHALEWVNAGSGIGPSLVRADREARSVTTLRSDVAHWRVGLGGEALLIEGESRDGQRPLWTWDARLAAAGGDGLRLLSADFVAADLLRGDRLATFSEPSGQRIVWDLRETRPEVLGPTGGLVGSPDGSALVAALAVDGSPLILWDADGPALRDLGEGSLGLVEFHPEGRRLIHAVTRDGLTELHHLDLDTGHGVRLAAALHLPSAPRYLPGDGGILWVRPAAAAGRRELVRAAGPAAVPQVIATAERFGTVAWSEDGALIAFTAGPEGEGVEHELVVHLAGGAPRTVATGVSSHAPRVSRDGAGVLFFQGGTGGRYRLLRWSRASDRIDVLAEELPSYTLLDAGAPGTRVCYQDDGAWFVWDIRRGEAVPAGNGRGGLYPGSRQFLPDGPLLAVALDGTLLLVDGASGEERVIGRGVTSHVPQVTADGRRILYQVDSWSGLGRSLVLFDRDLDRAIPIDDHVGLAVLGRNFVAYGLSGDPDRPAGLYLATYPPGN